MKFVESEAPTGEKINYKESPNGYVYIVFDHLSFIILTVEDKNSDKSVKKH